MAFIARNLLLSNILGSCKNKCLKVSLLGKNTLLSYEQKPLHLPSVYSLTQSLAHSLTHSSVCIMLLKTCQRWKNHTLAKLLQAASHLVNAPWRQQPENSLEEYLANNNNKSKTINLSTVITLRTRWESTNRDEATIWCLERVHTWLYLYNIIICIYFLK